MVQYVYHKAREKLYSLTGAEMCNQPSESD